MITSTFAISEAWICCPAKLNQRTDPYAEFPTASTAISITTASAYSIGAICPNTR